MNVEFNEIASNLSVEILTFAAENAEANSTNPEENMSTAFSALLISVCGIAIVNGMDKKEFIETCEFGFLNFKYMSASEAEKDAALSELQAFAATNGNTSLFEADENV